MLEGMLSTAPKGILDIFGVLGMYQMGILVHDFVIHYGYNFCYFGITMGLNLKKNLSKYGYRFHQSHFGSIKRKKVSQSFVSKNSAISLIYEISV